MPWVYRFDFSFSKWVISASIGDIENENLPPYFFYIYETLIYINATCYYLFDIRMDVAISNGYDTFLREILHPGVKYPFFNLPKAEKRRKIDRD